MIKNLNLKNDYDLDKDGSVSDQEVARSTAVSELELKEEKALTQKRMAWASLISMIAITAALLTPYIGVDRVEALSTLLGMYYLSVGSILGFYFGVTAYMSK